MVRDLWSVKLGQLARYTNVTFSTLNIYCKSCHSWVGQRGQLARTKSELISTITHFLSDRHLPQVTNNSEDNLEAYLALVEFNASGFSNSSSGEFYSEFRADLESALSECPISTLRLHVSGEIVQAVFRL